MTFMELEKSVSRLSDLFEKQEKSFEPYIQHIRFPKYKGIKSFEEVHFKFPVSIIVGENGCNKTSVLQALYGAPDGKSVGDYWFETEVDKITENEDEFKSCFIYGYKNHNAKKTVEVLKTRIKKTNRPEYWEPARPQVRYGMVGPTADEVEKHYTNNKTRWDTLKKNVVYCDCKEYVSAYDLFFYHYDFLSSQKYRTRQDFIRERSKSLSKVINNNLQTFNYYGKNRIKEIENVQPEICSIVSDIMDVTYSEIKIVTHQLYAKSAFRPSKTIWIKKDDKNYSEAFAGTGEARIILLINDLFNAPEKSLILIDEPEISLHPTAINNLKRYILQLALIKKHQVIITTHSPKFTEGFPANAINLMKLETDGINIYGNVDSREAFSKLGETLEKHKRLYVEDVLMEYIVGQVVEIKDAQFIKETLNISASLGGADNIKKRIEAAAFQGQNDCYYLLDGDQKKSLTNIEDAIIKKEWISDDGMKVCEDKIPIAENKKLEEIINIITGTNIKFYVSSNGSNKNLEELYKVQRNFINFWNNNVFFLFENTPELALAKLDDSEVKLDSKDLTGKNFFVSKTQEIYQTKVGSDEILHVQRQVLGKLKKTDLLYKNIDNILEEIFS